MVKKDQSNDSNTNIDISQENSQTLPTGESSKEKTLKDTKAMLPNLGISIATMRRYKSKGLIVPHGKSTINNRSDLYNLECGLIRKACWEALIQRNYTLDEIGKILTKTFGRTDQDLLKMLEKGQTKESILEDLKNQYAYNN